VISACEFGGRVSAAWADQPNPVITAQTSVARNKCERGIFISSVYHFHRYPAPTKKGGPKAAPYFC
jgi:hypothetical protein